MGDVTWETVLQMIGAAAALGTAAFGLVDVSKFVRQGLPSAGFSDLDTVYRRLGHTLERALADANWRRHLMSFWIGGAPKEDQKAKVRTLVRLGFGPDPAIIGELADFAHLDAERLNAVAVKLEMGATLTEQDINLLGRLDATIDLRIDAAFERAEQAYRNAARLWAAVVAVGLATAAAYGLKSQVIRGVEPSDAQFWLIIAMGFVAVPLAPIAKDLSSALAAAARVATSVRPAGT